MEGIILIQVLMVIVASGPIAFGVLGFLRERHFKLFGVETDAKVIAFKSSGNSAAPEVEYQTEEGTIRSKSWFSMTRGLYSFNVGDTIRIRYDRMHIKRFRIVGSKLPTVMFSILIFAGIFVLAVMAFIVMPVLS